MDGISLIALTIATSSYMFFFQCMQVEMFVKEHIRPLCKSGVITVDQYRWAVTKTTDKVMNFHRDAKNASFLIKEGDKVKKLALQYVEAAQQKIN